MAHARFTLHPEGQTTKAPSRFDTPIARPLADDERLYVSGTYTLTELKRLIAWAQGRPLEPER